MAIERSLILLKPDCLNGHHAGEVIGRFEKAGFEIRATKLIALSDELLKEHYAHIADRPFFPDIVEFAESMADAGKTVVVAALDGTYQRKGFASILELVPLAEHVTKLTAVCMICFEEGSYTKRITEDKEVTIYTN